MHLRTPVQKCLNLLGTTSAQPGEACTVLAAAGAAHRLTFKFKWQMLHLCLGQRLLCHLCIALRSCKSHEVASITGMMQVFTQVCSPYILTLLLPQDLAARGSGGDMAGRSGAAHPAAGTVTSVRLFLTTTLCHGTGASPRRQHLGGCGGAAPAPAGNAPSASH